MQGVFVARTLNEAITKFKLWFRLHSTQAWQHSDSEIGEAVTAALGCEIKLEDRVEITLALRESAMLCEAGSSAPPAPLLRTSRCWKLITDDQYDGTKFLLAKTGLDDPLRFDLFHEIFYRTYWCNRVHDYAATKPEEVDTDIVHINCFVRTVLEDSAELQSSLMFTAITEFAQCVQGIEYHGHR